MSLEKERIENKQLKEQMNNKQLEEKMENKKSDESYISIIHPLNGNKYIVPLDNKTFELERTISTIKKYIERDYSDLFHYNGIVYPFLSVFFPQVDDINFFIFSNGNYYIKLLLKILNIILCILKFSTENVNKDKLKICNDAKNQVIEFIVNILSEILFDTTTEVFESIPLKLRRCMINKYIERKIVELTSKNPFPQKKYRTPSSFSNIFDNYLLHQYMMYLHNNRKKKEEVICNFVSKFLNDDYFNLVMRESFDIYRKNVSQTLNFNYTICTTCPTTSLTTGPTTSLTTGPTTSLTTGPTTSLTTGPTTSQVECVNENSVANLLVSLSNNTSNKRKSTDD